MDDNERILAVHRQLVGAGERARSRLAAGVKTSVTRGAGPVQAVGGVAPPPLPPKKSYQVLPPPPPPPPPPPVRAQTLPYSGVPVAALAVLWREKWGLLMVGGLVVIVMAVLVDFAFKEIVSGHATPMLWSPVTRLVAAFAFYYLAFTWMRWAAALRSSFVFDVFAASIATTIFGILSRPIGSIVYYSGGGLGGFWGVQANAALGWPAGGPFGYPASWPAGEQALTLIEPAYSALIMFGLVVPILPILLHDWQLWPRKCLQALLHLPLFAGLIAAMGILAGLGVRQVALSIPVNPAVASSLTNIAVALSVIACLQIIVTAVLIGCLWRVVSSRVR